MDINILPYGKITSTQKLGQAVRAKRKSDGLTQAKAAALCGVGVRFISDLENGKSTVELGKVLAVLNGLGLSVDVRPKGTIGQKRVTQDKMNIRKKVDQDKLYRISDNYINAISKIADSYRNNMNLSSKAFNDLSKHRKDFYSLGISMDKYNDIARSYKKIIDINSNAISRLINAQTAIDNLGMKKSTVDKVINSVNATVNLNNDALKSISNLRSTIERLNLNTKFIDNLKKNYKDTLSLSKTTVDSLNRISDMNIHKVKSKK